MIWGTLLKKYQKDTVQLKTLLWWWAKKLILTAIICLGYIFLLCHSGLYQEIGLNWGRFSMALFTQCVLYPEFSSPRPPKMKKMAWRWNSEGKLWLSEEKANHPEVTLQGRVWSMKTSFPRVGVGLQGERWKDSGHTFFLISCCQRPTKIKIWTTPLGSSLSTWVAHCWTNMKWCSALIFKVQHLQHFFSSGSR